MTKTKMTDPIRAAIDALERLSLAALDQADDETLRRLRESCRTWSELAALRLDRRFARGT
jgi:hypothetical protein